MNRIGRHVWALVLAAGEGARLRDYTRDSAGTIVPKQYCTLAGGPTLLQETLARAAGLAGAEHSCVIVAAEHRRWWKPALEGMRPDRVIVQPRNRGTAIGVLLAMEHIVALDPEACVVMLPADHYVEREEELSGAIARAARVAGRATRMLVLVGVAPEWPDTQLGYILPETRVPAAIQRVGRFVEKPDGATAERLLAQGARWNTFIVAGRADAYLRLLRQALPAEVAIVERALALDRAAGSGEVHVDAAYSALPVLDFSRDVLAPRQAQLLLCQAPACGWTDLGTPDRLAQALRRHAAGREFRWFAAATNLAATGPVPVLSDRLPHAAQPGPPPGAVA